MRSSDSGVAGRFSFRPRVDRVEPVVDPRLDVCRLAVGVAKQEFLGRHAAARVDHDTDIVPAPGLDSGGDVRKEWYFDVARSVAVLPNVALEGLEVGDLDISTNEVPYMCLKSGRADSVLFRKGFTVRSELGAVPLRGKHAGKGFETVGKLDGTPKASQLKRGFPVDFRIMRPSAG